MFSNILVLVDSGDPEQPALKRALQCTNAHTQIHVFDVVYEPALEGYMGDREVHEPLRRRLLDERFERARSLASAVESWGVRGSANAVWANPVQLGVAAEVRARGSDLVVMAPRLRSHSGALSHSDWQLLVHCPVPVLVVRSDGETKYRKIVAAVDPFHAHAKPGDLDLGILSAARELARLTGSSLTALHCYQPIEYFGADLAAPLPERADDGRMEKLQALLAEADMPADSARLVAGAPHTILRNVIDRGEADLIVMGALARGHLKDLIIGNTAERVLHGITDCDVLVVSNVTAERARARVPAEDWELTRKSGSHNR